MEVGGTVDGSRWKSECKLWKSVEVDIEVDLSPWQ